jgi:hypothetical protein
MSASGDLVSLAYFDNALLPKGGEAWRGVRRGRVAGIATVKSKARRQTRMISAVARGTR